MAKIKINGYECERCRHQWRPRKTTQGDPIICPSCKSQYWNKPRKIKKTKK